MKRLWDRLSTPFAILAITLFAIVIWHIYTTHINNQLIIKQKQNGKH